LPTSASLPPPFPKQPPRPDSGNHLSKAPGLRKRIGRFVFAVGAAVLLDGKMKLIPILCAALLPAGLLTGREASPKPPTVEQLEKAGIVGRLGLPLGQVAEMEGEIVSPESSGAKEDEGLLLMKVTSIIGKLQPHPQLLRFTLPGGEKPPAGTKMKFRGYETGGFKGLPENWPDDVPRQAGVAFQFESHLVILAVP
jgi:hypothetical protein